MKELLNFNDAIKLFSEKVTVPSELEDIIISYANNVLSDLRILKDAIKDMEMEKSEKIIHKLTGTAESYGFNVVDSILRTIKALLQEGEFISALDLCDRLVKYVDDFTRGANG